MTTFSPTGQQMREFNSFSLVINPVSKEHLANENLPRANTVHACMITRTGHSKYASSCT
jgi:hypothetical protein